MYCQRPSRNPEAITRADLEMEMEEEEHLFAFSRKDEDEDEEEGGKKERGACGQTSSTSQGLGTKSSRVL